MKKELRINISFAFFLIFILIFEISNAYAQKFRGGSFDVVLIGNIIDPDEQGNNKTFELWTDEDKWRFTVTEPHVLNSTTISGWRLLHEIFPKRLKLYGDESVMKPLKQSDIIGNNIKLRGRIQHTTKRFFLTSVEEVIEEKKSEEEKKK